MPIDPCCIETSLLRYNLTIVREAVRVQPFTNITSVRGEQVTLVIQICELRLSDSRFNGAFKVFSSMILVKRRITMQPQ